MSTPPQEPKKNEESLTDKLKSSIESLKQHEKVDQVVRYASSNTRDMLAYILMLTGLFLLFYQPAYAGALIGVIFGLYFAPEIAGLFKTYSQWIDKLGLVRTLILAGLLIAFFISAPFIFFGAIVAVAVRQLLD
ncbi:MAG: hypothetical protein LLG04_15565 [Parachlamydia sp.]|nr:hypothetical protein [Parachlamydia sp.]